MKQGLDSWAGLTAWELVQEGIPATLIADSVALVLIRDKIDVIMGLTDRIALNGDTANKIGNICCHNWQ